jgi:hypothetical protein
VNFDYPEISGGRVGGRRTRLWDRPPYTVLLISLLVFVLMVPFVSQGTAGVFLVRIGFTAILLAGFYVARGSRSLRRSALLVIVFGLAVEWLTYFLRLPAGPQIRLLLDAILFLLVAAVQLYAILGQRRVSADTVVGGIVPVSGAAKLAASCEALFGQIYLATFIARLVALYVAGAKSDEDEYGDRSGLPPGGSLGR